MTANTQNSSEKIILIDKHNYSGAEETETIIFTEYKSLKLFYAKVNRTRKPGLPLPNVDFNNEIVVVHCSADENYKNTNQLTVLKETDNELFIRIEELPKKKPDNSALNVDIEVTPFFVYKMPKTNKKVIIAK
ncbi:hypothetical protein GH721_01270 [Kriegella sp. EG-1]|nr:hypothetical protein [Flavobacteriaceae bacterium EG-1]